jgi:carbon storage regulator CsrA
MLIVGRGIGQSVIIGDVVKVTVLQFGSKLQLAIDAPKHIRVSQINQLGSDIRILKTGARIIGATSLIGDIIKVTILQTEAGLLRLAIDAPKDITIFREELYQGKRISRNQNVNIL